MPELLAALSGLGLGLSLIVAIGSQNAFVLRQGLRRQGVGTVVLVWIDRSSGRADSAGVIGTPGSARTARSVGTRITRSAATGSATDAAGIATRRGRVAAEALVVHCSPARRLEGRTACLGHGTNLRAGAGRGHGAVIPIAGPASLTLAGGLIRSMMAGACCRMVNRSSSS